ncbi:MAG: hypothetical protein M0042_09045 [Nitrospiraceae bacterium]|nr:hypothetical protein [Nitrospiraceae bacterium]
MVKYPARFIVALVLLAVLSFGPGAVAGTELIGGVSRDEALRLGEGMYRDGILPSGKPMQAVVKGDIPVESRFTCANCHQRSGFGSMEGTIKTAPIDGTRLYAPVAKFRRMPLRGARQQDASPDQLLRPAYTDETLAFAMRTGIDPGGRQMNTVMPVYDLSDRDMAILVFYLKNLSVGTEPGVTDREIRFATIVSDDVAPADREAMLGSLAQFIEKWRVPKNVERMVRAQTYLQEGAARETRTPVLALWELKGPAEGWGAQLDAYYRKEPVFALLGGITGSTWTPIHRFCEEHRIPAIYPVTDHPVISETDWYTLYLSKGLQQEGEAAARYLHGRGDLAPDATILQIHRGDPSGLALARSFGEQWISLGHRPPEVLVLGPSEKLSEARKGTAGKTGPLVLLLWTAGKDIPSLSTDAAGIKPEMIFLSSSLAGERLYDLAEALRPRAFITYPLALPRAQPGSKVSPARSRQEDIRERMFALFQTINYPLSQLRTFVYRDYFLELIEKSADITETTVSPRLSFGTGQRYASKGCYIVQLSSGPTPTLVKQSEWMHF